jgi:hypothetical protein
MYKKMIYYSCVLLVLSLASNSMAELVAYYSMDEGQGDIVADSSGNGHNGTISGNPTWVEGPPGLGTAVLFGTQGSNPIDCGMWDNTLGTGEMTVGCWVKFSTGGTTYQGIVSNRTAYSADQMYWALEINGPSGEFYFGSLNGSAYGLGTVEENEWEHIAITFDGQTLVAYLNGEEINTGSPAYGNTPESTIRIGASEAGGNIFEGAIDEVYFFNTIFSAAEIESLMNGEMNPGDLNPGGAKLPEPADQSTDIFRDVVLSWTPGRYAQTHNVYLGMNFDDVNEAGTDSPLLVGPGISQNTFSPGRLDFSQTYFWRVDEVNAPPDNTVFKGDIWSFTVEHVAYPIPAANITPTASGQSTGQGPEKTIDGSGLDANDLHSINAADMWLSSAGDPGSAWIQYEFDKPYKLHEMLVWNYNGDSILSLYGIKEVTIEYSTDGVTWAQANVSELNQASGAEGYAANTTVSFDGADAKYVKVIANNNWGGGSGFFNQYGLSEVRFLYIPVDARKPAPEDGATEVAIDAALSWGPGREAAEHQVYISTDQEAVLNGTAPVVTVSQASYGPLSLDLGRKYFWRVDEVNNAETPSVRSGDTWSFSTQEYLVVEDFESYNDIPTGEAGSNLVYDTWVDGYDNPSINGSTMGYSEAFQPTMETAIVHGGRQSAPLIYDNSAASKSEVTASTSDLSVGSNWTIGAPDTLVLWFYGDPNNAGTEQLYVKLNSSKQTISGIDLTLAQWQSAEVSLADFGINLANVTQVVIGLEKTGATGSAGILLVDDIRLSYVEQ